MNVASGILLQRVSVSRFMIEPKNGPVQGVTRLSHSPGTRTRDRARRWYTLCNKFAMDDVESGDAAPRSCNFLENWSAHENRIPNGDCINRHEFWGGRVVLQSVSHGITRGGSYFSNALKYLFDG